MANAKLTKPEAISIAAALLVLFSAMWVPFVSFSVSVLALVAFGFYKLTYN